MRLLNRNFAMYKTTKLCHVVLEKCPITNLKTARVLLDRCPVKDLKIPVIKLRKVTLPTTTNGGDEEEKTSNFSKIAPKKKKQRSRIIPKALTIIKKKRRRPPIVRKSLNGTKSERAKSVILNRQENNNDSDKENEKPSDNPTVQENKNYVVERKTSIQRKPLSELKIQNAFSFTASNKNRLKNIVEQKAMYHNFFTKSEKKLVTFRKRAGRAGKIF